ncbi:ribosome small subunit-dependent GTPase A [Janthinobacterium fluminis]|uniref:Small ribosomal subunit biogenesis GTPase RsgA n=1 Tax=Janthinobacterium fluminis TaxID=2987524 RepID=A0ABT5JZA5_9BURK|nr:ribosome small subunit-dependent GTPase A [Janthinobacterium fluminis]MDC8758057.1 ribosome small subunit-dependent GTPase A [Janthinobacterium fluminis]
MINFDFESLKQIGLTHAIASQLATFNDTEATLARVTAVHREWIAVHDGAAAFEARIHPKLMQALQERDVSLAVGDWVLAEAHAHDEYWLSERLEPSSHLSRRSDDGRRQSLASNVDTALLVMGLDRDFKLRRMERYIALVEAAGVAAVAVLTKADIGDDVAARMEQLRQRLPPRVPAFAVNALDEAVAASLAPWLAAGQTLILLGTSGVGKSTLTNTLTASAQATGGVRRGDGRGRHTTTARSLHQCAGGACIIDTPGLRAWRPDADADALAASFDDIDALARQCQFRDCRHEAEPGCAVRGGVDADRLFNYNKLLREHRRAEQTPLERIAARSKWKVLMKAVKARDRHK